jgi:hypothetical protein
MIEWANVQAALTRAGHACGLPDGKPGPLTFTALSVLVSALWVQANDLALLPAGLSGTMFGALGLASSAWRKAKRPPRAAFQAFVRSIGTVKPPENPGG